ncbi:MAG: DNA polymerase III subunit gamma/tau, partial [Mesorhizobium sp.]
QTRMPSGSGGAQSMRLVEASPAAVAYVAPPEPAMESAPLKSLADIIALADAQRDIAFKVLVKSCIRFVRIEPGRIDVGLTSDAPK